MVTDVASQLSGVLHDVEASGRAYSEGAAKLRGAGRNDLAERFESLSGERCAFAAELSRLAAIMQLEVRTRVGLSDTLHRRVALARHVFRGDAVATALGAALNANERALSTVQHVLRAPDLPATARTLLERQVVDLASSGREVRSSVGARRPRSRSGERG